MFTCSFRKQLFSRLTLLDKGGLTLLISDNYKEDAIKELKLPEWWKYFCKKRDVHFILQTLFSSCSPQSVNIFSYCLAKTDCCKLSNFYQIMIFPKKSSSYSFICIDIEKTKVCSSHWGQGKEQEIRSSL